MFIPIRKMTVFWTRTWLSIWPILESTSPRCRRLVRGKSAFCLTLYIIVCLSNEFRIMHFIRGPSFGIHVVLGFDRSLSKSHQASAGCSRKLLSHVHFFSLSVATETSMFSSLNFSFAKSKYTHIGATAYNFITANEQHASRECHLRLL